MYYIIREDELNHHGVKGMKWGVRKSQIAIGLLRKRRLDAKEKRGGFKRKYDVDVSIAKNSPTRRVAQDYHNLSEWEFRVKHKASKNKFAKRYNKTEGDTYSLGLKKQRAALIFLSAKKGYNAKKTAATIMKYEGASRAEQKLIDKGHVYAAKAISGASAEMMKKEFADTYYMPPQYRKKYGL